MAPLCGPNSCPGRRDVDEIPRLRTPAPKKQKLSGNAILRSWEGVGAEPVVGHKAHKGPKGPGLNVKAPDRCVPKGGEGNLSVRRELDRSNT